MHTRMFRSHDAFPSDFHSSKHEKNTKVLLLVIPCYEFENKTRITLNKACLRIEGCFRGGYLAVSSIRRGNLRDVWGVFGLGFDI
ncbi:hypothetical protein QVD17_04593 [Tagetes erecta]|uniref:Uncharacterized protein n=1 Tax=Tagetes erecta TaxID=13708 RepID=A0AAD8P9W4_TARER|nr:hypothetical protein QVD17_04593 [Tagetes erecta]